MVAFIIRNVVHYLIRQSAFIRLLDIKNHSDRIKRSLLLFMLAIVSIETLLYFITEKKKNNGFHKLSSAKLNDIWQSQKFQKQ